MSKPHFRRGTSFAETGRCGRASLIPGGRAGRGRGPWRSGLPRVAGATTKSRSGRPRPVQGSNTSSITRDIPAKQSNSSSHCGTGRIMPALSWPPRARPVTTRCLLHERRGETGGTEIAVQYIPAKHSARSQLLRRGGPGREVTGNNGRAGWDVRRAEAWCPVLPAGGRRVGARPGFRTPARLDPCVTKQMHAPAMTGVADGESCRTSHPCSSVPTACSLRDLTTCRRSRTAFSKV